MATPGGWWIFFDVQALSGAVCDLLDDAPARAALGARARALHRRTTICTVSACRASWPGCRRWRGLEAGVGGPRSAGQGQQYGLAVVCGGQHHAQAVRIGFSVATPFNCVRAPAQSSSTRASTTACARRAG